ncbi:hypothetical protein SEA_DATBOI_1 [Gordonia phage DatBoi]|nr:hypothetical protein SEA_DATBOI_1 [Gordonia phage DatBoi]
MSEEKMAFFEGRRAASGVYVYTLYPPAINGVADNQVHMVPPGAVDRKHQFSDDCWCVPRVEFKGAGTEVASWIYTHQEAKQRHSDERREGVQREDARQGGLVTGVPAADELERPDPGEEDPPAPGGPAVEERGGLSYRPTAAEIKALRNATRSGRGSDEYYRAPIWLCAEALTWARGDRDRAIEYMRLTR